MLPILVTSYRDPDLDGAGCAVAYAEYLTATQKEAQVGLLGKLHDEVCFVIDRLALDYPAMIENADGFEQIALMDCSELAGLHGLIKPEKVVQIIDHRQIHEAHKFPHAQVQIELVGAAATLVAEKFMAANLPITRHSAILLQTAIISNTLNMKNSITTGRDKAAYAWLQQYSMLPEGFWREQFVAKSDLSGDKLRSRLDADFALFSINGLSVGVFQLEVMHADVLVAERQAEVLAALDRRQRAQKLDYVMLSVIDIVDDYNLFVTADVNLQAVLAKATDCQFTQAAIARRSPALFRKKLMPLIRGVLSGHNSF